MAAIPLNINGITIGLVRMGIFCNFAETLEGDAENLAWKSTSRLLAALD